MVTKESSRPKRLRSIPILDPSMKAASFTYRSSSSRINPVDDSSVRSGASGSSLSSTFTADSGKHHLPGKQPPLTTAYEAEQQQQQQQQHGALYHPNLHSSFSFNEECQDDTDAASTLSGSTLSGEDFSTSSLSRSSGNMHYHNHHRSLSSCRSQGSSSSGGRQSRRRVRFNVYMNQLHESNLTQDDMVYLWSQEEDYGDFYESMALTVTAITTVPEAETHDSCSEVLGRMFQACCGIRQPDGVFLCHSPSSNNENKTGGGLAGNPIMNREDKRKLKALFRATPDLLGLERAVSSLISQDRMDRRNALIEKIEDLQSCGWPDHETEARKLAEASIPMSRPSRMFARQVALGIAPTSSASCSFASMFGPLPSSSASNEGDKSSGRRKKLSKSSSKRKLYRSKSSKELLVESSDPLEPSTSDQNEMPSPRSSLRKSKSKRKLMSRSKSARSLSNESEEPLPLSSSPKSSRRLSSDSGESFSRSKSDRSLSCESDDSLPRVSKSSRRLSSDSGKSLSRSKSDRNLSSETDESIPRSSKSSRRLSSDSGKSFSRSKSDRNLVGDSSKSSRSKSPRNRLRDSSNNNKFSRSKSERALMTTEESSKASRSKSPRNRMRDSSSSKLSRSKSERALMATEESSSKSSRSKSPRNRTRDSNSSKSLSRSKSARNLTSSESSGKSRSKSPKKRSSKSPLRRSGSPSAESRTARRNLAIESKTDALSKSMSAISVSTSLSSSMHLDTSAYSPPSKPVYRRASSFKLSNRTVDI